MTFAAYAKDWWTPVGAGMLGATSGEDDRVILVEDGGMRYRCRPDGINRVRTTRRHDPAVPG